LIVEIPFKAHNSKYVNEDEELRDRLWRLSMSNINFKTIENVSINEIYEKFSINMNDVEL
jgi:hypothetical protein